MAKYEGCPYTDNCKQGNVVSLTDAEKKTFADATRCRDCGEVRYTRRDGMPEPMSEPEPAQPRRQRAAQPAEEAPAEEAPASG